MRALELDRLEDLTTWPGAYLLLIVRPGELTAFVDLAGQFPLYYRSDPGRTVFGTRAAVTADAAGLTLRPDLLSLLAQVLCPAVPALTDGRSAFTGLSRLGGGQALRVAANGDCRTWSYESLVPDPEADLAQGAEVLRGALVEAVRVRVDTGRHLTADFSGGLDSTSLAFLAARQRSRPLPVFTYHHPDAPADDLVHAERYARLDEESLSLTVVLGTPDVLPFHEMAPSAGADVPDPAAVVRARNRLRLAHIAASGHGIHLGGEGADPLLVPPPGYLADLARFGTLRQLGTHCRAQARRRKVAPAAVFTRSIRTAATSFDRALRRLAARLEKPNTRTVHWLDAIAWWPEPGVEATWLTARMRTELADFVRDAAVRAPMTAGLGVGDYAALGELRAAASVQRQFSETAREFSVAPHAPFLDNNVVRACLSVPAHAKADPVAFKPLLGKALSGLVPEPVLRRTTKGSYSGEDYSGARRAAPQLRRQVNALKLTELGVVQAEPVTASLERAVMGIQAPFPAFTRLLSADLWLEGLSSW